MKIEIEEIKIFNGEKIIDIGRIISKRSMPIEGYSINDFDADVYIKFENKILLFNVYPTFEGDILNCYIQDCFEKVDSFMPCSFKEELNNFINKKIITTNVSINENLHQYKISFNFNTINNLDLLVIDSDEIVIKY